MSSKIEIKFVELAIARVQSGESKYIGNEGDVIGKREQFAIARGTSANRERGAAAREQCVHAQQSGGGAADRGR